MSSYSIAVFLSLIIGLAVVLLWTKKRHPDQLNKVAAGVAVSVVVMTIIAIWKNRREKQ